MSNRCITCGSPVRTESGDEGTGYYVPIVDDETIEVLREAEKHVDGQCLKYANFPPQTKIQQMHESHCYELRDKLRTVRERINGKD